MLVDENIDIKNQLFWKQHQTVQLQWNKNRRRETCWEKRSATTEAYHFIRIVLVSGAHTNVDPRMLQPNKHNLWFTEKNRIKKKKK